MEKSIFRASIAKSRGAGARSTHDRGRRSGRRNRLAALEPRPVPALPPSLIATAFPVGGLVLYAIIEGITLLMVAEMSGANQSGVFKTESRGGFSAVNAGLSCMSAAL